MPIADLQYPLPGLSHCDEEDVQQSHECLQSCSTLYRAYPIATMGIGA